MLPVAGETLLDGCHQQRVDPVSFLHVLGDLTSQGIKVKGFRGSAVFGRLGHVLEGWEGSLVGAGVGRGVLAMLMSSASAARGMVHARWWCCNHWLLLMMMCVKVWEG